MKSTELLMFVAIIAVALASINLIITINKIGDFRTLVGFVTDIGTANLTISSNIQVNFTLDNLDWGSGTVAGTNDSCELSTYGVMNGTGFNNLTEGLTLENIGNADATLNLTASKNAASFIGGSVVTPQFQWNITYNGTETGTCPNPLGNDGLKNITVWTDVTTTSGGTRACDNFTWRGSEDEIQVEVRIVIPSDAEGTKGVTITADAVTYSP